jgi:hypothetical protein
MSKTRYGLNMPSTSITPYMTSVNLRDLHGCTINFTYPTPQPVIERPTETEEEDVSSIDMYM